MRISNLVWMRQVDFCSGKSQRRTFPTVKRRLSIERSNKIFKTDSMRHFEGRVLSRRLHPEVCVLSQRLRHEVFVLSQRPCPEVRILSQAWRPRPLYQIEERRSTSLSIILRRVLSGNQIRILLASQIRVSLNNSELRPSVIQSRILLMNQSRISLDKSKPRHHLKVCVASAKMESAPLLQGPRVFAKQQGCVSSMKSPCYFNQVRAASPLWHSWTRLARSASPRQYDLCVYKTCVQSLLL